MQSAIDNSESQDDDTAEQNQNDDNVNTISNITFLHATSNGYYDAEKCRAYIANQSRVNKVHRFAYQILKALEIEVDVTSRLSAILNMYLRRSCRVVFDFSSKCKLGVLHHRQDRILNQPRKHNPSNKRGPAVLEQSTINNDLLYGEGAQLLQELLTQPLEHYQSKKTKRKNLKDLESRKKSDVKDDDDESDSLATNTFEPRSYVMKLEDCIRVSMRSSKVITNRLNDIKHSFEKLVTDHRDRFEMVYALEEERQASTIVRRSTYNLNSKIVFPVRNLVP